MHVWPAKSPLMGISAGEDLFLVIPTWRWDNRAGQPCYMFTGDPQHGFYTKECQEALWRKNKKMFPQGGSLLIQTPAQGNLQFCPESDLSRGRLGAWPSQGRTKSHRLESCLNVFPYSSPFASYIATGLRAALPHFLVEFHTCGLNIDRIFHVSPRSGAIRVELCTLKRDYK